MTITTADDLFAGAGGWDLGAKALNIDARGVENMKEARATRDAAGLTTIHDDVWTFRPDGTATGQIASPPCPTFSQAGKGTGRKALDSVLSAIKDGAYVNLDQLRAYPVSDDDDRTRLVLTPLHFATQYDHEWLAWEQVPTVLPVWEACAEVLRAKGFSVWTGLLTSEMYGVPQTRKRAFLLASRNHEVTPPVPTHSRYYPRNKAKLDPGVKKWVSMAEALNWGCDGGCAQLRNNNTANAAVRDGSLPAPTLYFGQRCNYCASEPSEAVMVSNYGSGGDASNRGTRTLAEPAPTVTSKIDRNKVYFCATNDRPNVAKRALDESTPTLAFGHERPRWCYERPSTTIVGTFKPEIVAAPGYRTTVSRQNAPDSVRVTVHEAGVLQSFPIDYPWQGAKGKQFLQAGNAVPVLLARAALSAVVS